MESATLRAERHDGPTFHPQRPIKPPPGQESLPKAGATQPTRPKHKSDLAVLQPRDRTSMLKGTGAMSVLANCRQCKVGLGELAVIAAHWS
jgi:hypothetical protein